MPGSMPQVWFSLVSPFPPTFKDQPNGFRFGCRGIPSLPHP